MTYLDYFKKSIERTKKFEFNLPNGLIIDSNERYINNEIGELIMSKMEVIYSELSNKDLSRQCIRVSYDMIFEVEKILGINAFLTFGYLKLTLPSGEIAYDWKFDEDYILDILNNTEKKTEFAVHAWITLPSLEIIDFTYGSTLGNHGSVLYKHPSELNNMEYIPMIIGQDFLENVFAQTKN